MNDRIQKLYTSMEAMNLDAVFVTLPKSVYYLTGFSTEPHERFLGLILPKGEEPFLIVPELDVEAARQASQVTRIFGYSDTKDPYTVLKSHVGHALKRVGIEKSHLSVRRYEELTQSLGIERYINVEETLCRMRAIKSPEEVARMKEAVRLAEEMLRIGVSKVAVGMMEIEIAAEIEYAMKRSGVSPAFSTTVLAGEKSAMPHGATGNRKIARGDLLLFDMGVCADGYLSDMTRTFAVGDIDNKKAEIYETVLQANLLAIEAIRPNVIMADVDRTAREYIAAIGYGPYFIHRLGHGLGIEIHEYPSLHGANQDPLLEGMVVTIEPGIYVPDVGGVRIEDDILVTSTGVEVLNAFEKTLTIIG